MARPQRKQDTRCPAEQLASTIINAVGPHVEGIASKLKTANDGGLYLTWDTATRELTIVLINDGQSIRFVAEELDTGEETLGRIDELDVAGHALGRWVSGEKLARQGWS